MLLLQFIADFLAFGFADGNLAVWLSYMNWVLTTKMLLLFNWNIL